MNAKLFDLLWRKYWINTLTSNPLIRDRALFSNQIQDLTEKVKQAESQMGKLVIETKTLDRPLPKLCKDRYVN